MSWQIQPIQPKNYIADIADSALAIDMVSDCSNMDFFGGLPRSLPNPRQIFVPTVAPIALGYYEFATYRRWVYGANNAQMLTVFDGATQYNVSPASGLTASTYWQFDRLNGFAICTNGKSGEAPHSLIADGAPATLAVPLVGWTAGYSAHIILGHRNQLIAINTTESAVHFGTRVRWSNSAVSNALPTEWVATVTNNAGAFDPGVPGGEILAACSLGDSVFLGGRGGVWEMAYTGGNFVYAFSPTPISAGVRGENCLCSLGDSLAVLTQNDLIQYNGASERSLIVGKHAKSLFAKIGSKARLLYLNQSRQLLILYDIGSQTGYSEALIWDRDTDTWGRREFANQYTDFAVGFDNTSSLETTWTALGGKYTWATWGSRANRPTWASTAYSSDASLFLGCRSGSIDTQTGNTYTWRLARTNIPIPDSKFGRIRDLRVHAAGSTGSHIKVRLGSAQHAEDSINWGSERSYTLGSDDLLHGDIQRGAFLSYELSGDGKIQISKIDLQMMVQGSKS